MKINKLTKKSDNFVKNANFKTSKIGLSGRIGFHNTKAPRKVHFNKWCR